MLDYMRRGTGKLQAVFSTGLTAVALTLAGTPAVAQQAAAPAVSSEPSAQEEPRFDIVAFDVEGATALDTLAIETAVYPFLGPSKTVADLNQAQRALETAYRDRGYDSVTVSIPEQGVESGVIRLAVNELRVGRVRVNDTRFYSPAEVRRAVPALAEGGVADFDQAERELNEVNRLPGRQVAPVVKPGQVPGTVDVDLNVTEDFPLHARIGLDNNYSVNTSPLRLSAGLTYDNLFQRGHTVTLDYVVAPERREDAEYVAFGYQAPLWNTPFTLAVLAYNSDSDVSTVGGAAVIGKGYGAGLRLDARLPDLGEAVLQGASIGLDYKHSADDIRLGDLPASVGEVDYWPLTASYFLRRETALATTLATISATANLRGLASNDDDFQTKRADARANFFRLNLGIEHTQAGLPLGLTLNGRLSGQFADQPLISNEQFALGGLFSVRGYLAAEALGDQGVFASGELRSPLLTPPVPGLDEVLVYGFFDAGSVSSLSTLPGERGETPLSSYGLGTRFQIFTYLDGDVVIAVPLRSGVTRVSERPYVTFSLKAEF